MDGSNMVNGEQLASYVQRISSLHADRDDLNKDISATYKDAKDAGFDITTLREIVRESRMEGEARTSRYALLQQYREALGLLADTPLGEAAMGVAEQRVVERPMPFNEQPVHRGRGRPRKQRAEENGDPVANAMQRAQTHLSGDTASASDYR